MDRKNYNDIDELIFNLELKMSKKNIKKKDLYSVINRNTVTKLFSKHEGTIDTLRKVINYINNKKLND